jgi:hypothetical protein
MLTPIEPADDYKHLSEQQVMQALADTDPSNPVAVEVARLVTGYGENFAAHCQQLGRIPTDILRIAPRWPIEGVAMRLAADSIRDELRKAGLR